MQGTSESVRKRIRLASLVVAVVMMCALVTGPSPAQASSGDYIVVLRPGVSLQAHLKAMKITPNRVYTHASTGYEAMDPSDPPQRSLALSLLRSRGILAPIRIRSDRAASVRTMTGAVPTLGE